MTEYTPGPWRVGGVEDLQHGRGRQIAADAGKICVVYGVRDPDVKANARLIAAAPDMYEELEAIAGNHDAGPGIDAEELCELMTQRARGVLAKIRGQVTV